MDFRNTVIIMTSNVGLSTIKSVGKVGFAATAQDQADYEKMKERVEEGLKRTFRPEFLNRIDETIVFHPLTREHIQQIVDLMLQEVAQRMEEHEVYLSFTEGAKEILAQVGYSEEYGARPLRREIHTRVEDHLSEEVIIGHSYH